MDAKQLLNEFSYIASAPEGVKRLRELIFSLAVQGELVPQDPQDESVMELLRGSWAELDRQLVSKEIKGRKILHQLVGEKTGTELPTGWESVPLGLLGQINTGNSISETDKVAKYSKVREGLPFISTKDVGYGRDRLLYNNGVVIPFDEPKFKIAPAKSVLICAEGGSAGRKMGITERDICFGNKLIALTTFTGLMPEFALVVYQSPMFLVEFRKRMTGIIG